MELKQLRDEIDSIDDQLMPLLERRMQLSKLVAEYKLERNLPIYVPEREQQILACISQRVSPEIAGYIESLYVSLFEISKSYQADLHHLHGNNP